MRRDCLPCLIDQNGEHLSLRRVPFSDKRLAEDFLQSALHRTPQLLPIEEIDSSYAPLISLGREIDSIDNLFISPTGRLTIVETKLWRNPEATREVVAQILDYTTRISAWSYSKLEGNARRAMSPAPIGEKSLYEFVNTSGQQKGLSEPQFVDEVQKTLETGRFLLLVVGDGIRENVENMLSALHEHPQKLFTFGLVELQIFEHPTMPETKLIVPQIVANSKEVVRAVVRVQTTGQASVSVESEEPESGKLSPGGRRTLSEDEFFDKIKDEDTRNLFTQLLTFSKEVEAEPHWCSNSVSIQLPDPNGSRQKLTLFVMTTSGEVYTGWLASQLQEVSKSETIAYDYVKNLAEMFLGVDSHQRRPDSLSRHLRATELMPKVDDFCEIVRMTVKRIRDVEEE